MSLVETFAKLFHDPRAVYVLIFVITFAGALAPINLPITPDALVTGGYNAIEKLKAGDVVMVWWDLSGGNERGVAPGSDAAVRHAISKGLGIILLSLSTENLFYGDREHVPYLWNVTRACDYAGYGTTLVDLGYLPGGRTVVFYTIAKNIRAYGGADRYGNKLDDLPMMKNVNDFTTVKAIIFCGAGGSPGCFEDAIGAFKRPYGTSIVIQGEEETITMAAFYAHLGLVDGVAYGSIGGRQYEVLTGIPGWSSVYATQLFYIGLLVVFGCVISNVYQLVLKKEGGT